MTTAVLVSGSGTILDAIVRSGIEVRVVASDRACDGLSVAERHGIEAALVARAGHGGFTAHFDREGFTAELTAALVDRDVDLVCMAGFGTVLAPSFFERFDGRILNTHPSLLPEFKGWHAVRDALAAGAATTGCTVHVATVAVDEGPILAQATVEVRVDDDEASLHERIKQVERHLYPEAIAAARACVDRGASPAALAIDAAGQAR